MGRPLAPSEIDKIILNYLNKKTKNGIITFNPLDVSVEGIATNLNLDYNKVKDSINRLSGSSNEYSSTKSIKVVRPRFEIWLPDEVNGADEIREELCDSGLAVDGDLNKLYSTILVFLCFLFIFYTPFVKSFFTTSFEWCFITGIIICAVSVPIGNLLAKKWFSFSLVLKSIPYYQVYVYALIGFLLGIIISIVKGWNVAVVVQSILSAIDIIIAGIQLSNSNVHKYKKHKR